MKKIYYSIYQSPIAPFFYSYSSEDIMLYCSWMINKKNIIPLSKNKQFKNWHYFEEQLKKYFNNKLKEFKITIKNNKIQPFTKNVLNIINSIPYGSVLSYKQIAQKLNNTKAYRAVGQACKYNPFPLIIPCHRVVAKNGYGGYAGKTGKSLELKIKKSLLELEGAISNEQ